MKASFSSQRPMSSILRPKTGVCGSHKLVRFPFPQADTLPRHASRQAVAALARGDVPFHKHARGGSVGQLACVPCGYDSAFNDSGCDRHQTGGALPIDGLARD